MYRRTWRYSLLPNFFEPVLYLVAMGIGVGAYITEMAGMSYLHYIAPGLIAVAAMEGASFEVTYNVYVRMTFEKAYDAMLTTPIEPDDVLAGETLWAVSRACIYGGAFLLVIIVFGLASPLRALWLIPIIPLAGLLFASLGIAFSLRIENLDLYSYYFTLFLTPMFLFSGVFFPIEERLTGVWLWVAEALPLLHPVRLSRTALRGDFSMVVLWDLAYTLGFSAVLLLGSRSAVKSRLTS